MNLIYTAYANSAKDPLPSLQEEDRAVHRVLTAELPSEDWRIHRDSYTTTDTICDYLLLHQNALSVFLFSGHAGKDVLFAEDGRVNADGVAAMLSNCKNVKLVILNGCSTGGQVETLLQAGIPVVIATSAPVGDRAATRFSISFFKSLCENNNSIVQAYRDGLAAAKAVASRVIKEDRSLDFRKPAAQTTEALWGIYHQPGLEVMLEWKIRDARPVFQPGFASNKLLLEKTWEAIAPYVVTPQQRARMSRNDRIDKIITELPHPISEFIRKLVAKPKPGEEEETFYHDLNENRLKYLVYTYTTSIELLAFTLLAQLWDERVKGGTPLFTDELTAELQTLFSLSIRERKTYSFIPLIQKMKRSLLAHNIAPFITEYLEISKEFNEGTEFHAACMHLEKVRNEIINEESTDAHLVRKYCIESEKQLAKVMEHTGFLAKYRMSSMKDINFIKYKHQTQPKYRLHFVDLKYRPSGMDVETETMPDSMDNSSIVIVKYTDEGITYLNLSPFIIDENSFDKKAKLANLVVFQSYQPLADAFTFRHVYRPLSQPLVVRKELPYFQLIAEQFDVFHRMVFGRNLTDHA